MTTFLLMLVCADTLKPKVSIETQSQAASLAFDWWQHYMHGGGCDSGEAWTEIVDGKVIYFVGKSTGDKTITQATIEAGMGGFRAVAYRRVWFGRGSSWNAAFVRAAASGYPPLLSNGDIDYQKGSTFLKNVGR